MKRRLTILTFSILWLALTACTPTADTTPTAVPNTPLPTPTLAPVVTENATATALAEPTPTAVPTQPTTELDTASLINLVQADLPENAFDGLDVLELNAANGPLWAVYSVGFHNFNIDPWPSHFVTLYTWTSDGWQELARQLLNTDELGDFGFGPDYLHEQGVTQVEMAPNDPHNLWLAVDGGAGAHGGTFQLLRFDGATLHLEINTGNASPGIGYFEDLNSDGNLELITRQHDYYVFCYACGVRYLNFNVYTWDELNQRLLEVSLQPMLMGQQDHPARQPTNRAMELANADLWPQALAQIEEAERLAAETDEPTDTFTLTWNAALIRLYNQAYQAELGYAPYPLLTNIFYGDYAAALDIMRGYGNEQIFTAASPLIRGTMAESNEQWLAQYILAQTNAAIAVQPDLAAAYYFRAWATYLNNPAAPQIMTDLQQATTRSPSEPLFVQVTLPTVRRIQFAPGETGAVIEGNLPAQGTDVYILSAQAGQQMMVMLTTPDENVRVSVQDVSGNYLYAQVTSTLWQGELPESGDYLVRVIGGETAVAYSLAVTIE